MKKTNTGIPTSMTIIRHDITWKYNLNKGAHTVRLKLVNPKKEHKIGLNYAIIYSDALVNNIR